MFSEEEAIRYGLKEIQKTMTGKKVAMVQTCEETEGGVLRMVKEIEVYLEGDQLEDQIKYGE